MGPRSFERGDTKGVAKTVLAMRTFNGAALFRARRPTSLETPRRISCSFNGAALFRARRLTLLVELEATIPALQWGRALSSAETSWRTFRQAGTVGPFNGAALFRARRPRGVGGTPPRSGPPSMGPRSFERGDVARPAGRAHGRNAPSMGPRSFERGDWWSKWWVVE